jgi:hypothetical protein
MLLKCIVFASLGYSYGPARYSGSEEGMVPATVAQAADCGNRRETKGQRGAGDRQGRECINFLNLRGRGDEFIEVEPIDSKSVSDQSSLNLTAQPIS